MNNYVIPFLFYAPSTRKNLRLLVNCLDSSTLSKIWPSNVTERLWRNSVCHERSLLPLPRTSTQRLPGIWTKPFSFFIGETFARFVSFYWSPFIRVQGTWTLRRTPPKEDEDRTQNRKGLWEDPSEVKWRRMKAAFPQRDARPEAHFEVPYCAFRFPSFLFFFVEGSKLIRAVSCSGFHTAGEPFFSHPAFLVWKWCSSQTPSPSKKIWRSMNRLMFSLFINCFKPLF